MSDEVVTLLVDLMCGAAVGLLLTPVIFAWARWSMRAEAEQRKQQQEHEAHLKRQHDLMERERARFGVRSLSPPYQWPEPMREVTDGFRVRR